MLGPEAASGATRTLGNLNESFAGTLQGLKGEAPFTAKGLDVGDLTANEEGIAQAQQELASAPPQVRDIIMQMLTTTATGGLSQLPTLVQ